MHNEFPAFKLDLTGVLLSLLLKGFDCLTICCCLDNLFLIKVKIVRD